MEKIEYPKWLYNAAGSVLVQNKEEHEALGDGYFDSPADVPAVAAEPDPVADAAKPSKKGKKNEQ